MMTRALLDALKRFWAVLVVAALLGVGAALGLSSLSKSRYEATSEMLFSISAASSATELNQASTYLDRAMTSYSTMVTTPYVLDPVIKKLGLRTDSTKLAKDITATVPSATVLLDVTVEADSPEAAESAANAIAEQMVSVVTATSPKAAGQPALKATIISPAVKPEFATGFGMGVRLALGLLGGLAVGGLVVWALAARDRTIRHPWEMGLHPVGLLRATKGAGPTTKGWTLSGEPASLGEDYRTLREALEGVWRTAEQGAEQRVLLVTSPSQSDDRTDVCVGLAQAFAETSTSVTLVDGDLRSQTLTALLGEPGQPGVTDVLTSGHSAAGATRPTRLKGVQLLGAGAGVNNAAGTLSAAPLERLVPPGSDIVIIDAPQCSNLSDATMLSSIATDSLMVVSMDSVSADALRASLDRWTSFTEPPVMVVATRVAPADIP